ncbi:hypothetical protein [Nocardioides sp. zg-1230]|uniref:hypothetical protein n=1 Tax=Nocardioides sp. zg-1230 TaxID=2736601 RepID=UPI00155702FA|nr:hypothetical protein [Nocardioides sp. zg-1230]NPC43535.1 hypothetical protein [Nocardioides sp. zg-1230]
MVVLVVIVLVRDGRQEVAPAPPVETPRASPAEAARALAAFVEAVQQRDAPAMERLAPSELPAARELLSGIAANARSLDLTAVSARYVDQVDTVSSDGSWTGVAELTWQLRGFDDEPARSDVAVLFAPDSEGLGIAGFEAFAEEGGRLPLWLRGRLSVARADDVLVMADGPANVAEAATDRAVRGIDVVRRALPDWSSPVVVEIPDSARSLDETLGAEPGTYAGIAAVTAPAGRASDVDGPVHVFVNPDVSDGLRRMGAQVVMSHELVHVATDAVRRPVEPWLLEGFADYVALRGTRLPDRVTLGRAIEAARRDGVPEALPTAADFDPRARNLQARYEEAWLACRIIAERVGERALIEVYGAATRRDDLERALNGAGFGLGDLTATWRDELRVRVRRQ